MRSVFVELSGGLGNQLFQASAAISTAMANDAQAYAYRGRHFAKSSHGNSIEDLNWHGQLQFKHPSKAVLTHRAFQFRKSRFLGTSKTAGVRYFWDASDDWVLPRMDSNRLYLRGYFQNSDFTEKNERFTMPTLRRPSSSFLRAADLAELSAPVGIHVRLGDYKKHAHTHGILPSEYYYEAIKAINNFSKIGEAWVFSDEDESAMTLIRETGLVSNLTAASSYGLNDLETMFLLSECKHLVLGNSTFSLWAGLLGKRVELAVRPDPAFVGIKAHPNLYPQKFEKVPSGWVRD